MILSSGLSSPVKSHSSHLVSAYYSVSVGMGERGELNSSVGSRAPHTSVFHFKSLYLKTVSALRELTTKVTTQPECLARPFDGALIV